MLGHITDLRHQRRRRDLRDGDLHAEIESTAAAFDAFTIDKIKPYKKKGTVEMTGRVPGPGELTLIGKR